MGQKFKRKLIIEPYFQLRGAWIITTICLVLAAFLIFTMALFVRHYFLDLDQDGSFISPEISKLYHQAWVQLLFLLCGISLLYGAIVFWAGLFITRNVVGPVVAFANRVRKLLQTESKENFTLRKGDELKDLIELYNDISKYVESRKR